MNESCFNIDPYKALKSILEVTSPHLGESFLQITCHELKKLFQADLVFITEAINCNPTTKVKILYGTNENLPNFFDVEGTPCKLVYGNKIIQINKGVNLKFEKEKNTGFESFYGIPIHDTNDFCIGHIAIFSKKPRLIPCHIEDIALIFARRIETEYQRDILEKENIKIHKELNQMIITDDLTGLFNRRHFHEVSEDILKQTQNNLIKATLSYLDIDDFKKINDSYGHDKGDKVLKYLATVLKQNCKNDKSFVFRIGGEEFAIINIDDTLDDTVQYITKVQNNLKNDSNNDLNITISIGIDCFKSIDCSVDDIYKRADKKMYVAKKSGKNCFKY